MSSIKAPQVVAVDVDNEQELSIFVTTLNASLHAVGLYSGRNLMRPAEAKVTMQMVALAQSLQTVSKQDIDKTAGVAARKEEKRSESFDRIINEFEKALDTPVPPPPMAPPGVAGVRAAS